MFFAKEKEISPIMIFGDSKAIVDSSKGIDDLHIIELHHWIRQIKNLINNFQQTMFIHIFWELNSEVDSLSKQDIGARMESIDWALFHEGTRIEHRSLNIS